jgi:hypothetical protein
LVLVKSHDGSLVWVHKEDAEAWRRATESEETYEGGR